MARKVPSLISLVIETIKREVVHGLLRTAMITRLLRTMMGESVGEMETLIRHGRRCLSCAGRIVFTLLKHNLTGDRYTGKHTCRSIATYSIYIYCLYLDSSSSSSSSSCINRINSCLDEAAELASLPSFDGCIGEMNVSDGILKCIGCEGHVNHANYSKLSYHCQQFGHYASCLRLQNVFCVAETCVLLRKSNLQSLIVRWIISEKHVDGLCKLLLQNSETLTSLEFIYCKLSPTFVSAICGSLNVVNTHTHGIKHFSINTSSFLEINPVSLPPGFVSFLSSGRSLCSLKLHDNHLDRNFAWMLFSVLLDASSSLSILDLSDNNIAGWLCNLNGKSKCKVPLSLGIGKSLQSLRVLNIRGNDLHKDDVESLRCALVSMPNLEILDISDNPIEDDGIRCLIPYIVEAHDRCSPLAELYLENCELSCSGATELLDSLSNLKRPLNSLSLADNGLGSEVAGPLQKILGTAIKTLNVGGVGLGSLGFQELEKGLMTELKLVDINISKNRGGFETARFLAKLISLAPNIIAINTAYNLMPLESLTVICSALKLSKGSLERLDLTGNNWDFQPNHASMVAEFHHNGRPILILPSYLAVDVPYDDDP
ncbi:PREDICTED: NACHT, LRR and PYD domains-containing protein 13 isoform X3 [Populus euphratica]|uniref:NACHT, LRR and PYD domains-containing protein 13 isoform X3 n=2 Tax=Populus euphratica TaxID=75702 RepID=A0AAJ6XDV0_POPEU|nr:PREDICTED: NACHT, LRR and PYD domains-containing protein 13 isoform X3 [Populus euphratica]